MIYIQSNTEKTLAHHFDASCALYGAIENELQYRLTSFEEVASGKFDLLIKRNLFVGSTEFMEEVFKHAGLGAKVRLPKNSNREHKIITLGEARNIASTGKEIFIKPTAIKLFTGFVLDNKMIYGSILGLPDDTEVMAYEPFTDVIESEWRIYIHRNQIADAKNYSGNFMVTPDYKYVQNVINENKTNFPCAYTMDIGILHDGENVVVEFNDMWAIGNYGLPNDIYLNLLRDRYFEIMRNEIW